MDANKVHTSNIDIDMPTRACLMSTRFSTITGNAFCAVNMRS